MKQNLPFFDDTYHNFINMVLYLKLRHWKKKSLIFIFRSLLIFLKVNIRLTAS